jgi:hypothetical protein
MSDAIKDSVKPIKIKASDHDIYGVTTIVSLLIPLVGIILGAVYLSKETKVDRKLGEHLIAVGILSCILVSIVWFIYGSTRVTLDTTSIPSPTTQITSPAVSTWDINSEYAKINTDMTKESVELAIGKTATNCSDVEQSGSPDKYSSCTYGGTSDGGIIIVNYKNNLVTTKEKATY